jgi:uncharacterized metal-binding protein YceD (DUF177 family)
MKPAASPVSMKVDVSRLPARGITVELDADDAQRAALAEQHNLPALSAFGFTLRVAPWKRDGAQVSGRVVANITQTCVVTLEPVEARIDEAVSAVFVPETSRLARVEMEGGEILLDAEGDDAPETFSDNRIDVGALAEEFFALAIDPYPRRAGIEMPENAGDKADDNAGVTPFAKLGSLVRKS